MPCPNCNVKFSSRNLEQHKKICQSQEADTVIVLNNKRVGLKIFKLEIQDSKTFFKKKLTAKTKILRRCARPG